MIRTINSLNEFNQLTESWRTLEVLNFGPLGKYDEDDKGSYEDTVMMFVESDGEAVAYLVAERNELWHIEVAESARGNGYARQLCETAKICFAWEVCSDEGAALCDALNIDFDDCR